MTKRDIVQSLEQAQRDAAENKDVEEISQSELDHIAGAWGGDSRFGKANWPRSF